MMKALFPHLRATRTATRNPERSRERILRAAFQEFASNGFAGARVDSIAHRAAINKRMLYHYFGHKEDLFREVLRRKMTERQSWTAATPDDPVESLPYWFDLARNDADWIRLLEWEALQFAGKRWIDEDSRRQAARAAAAHIRRRQQLGHLSKSFTPQHTLLAMIAVTWFPIAFPQLTRIITGRSTSDARFISEQRGFLGRFAAAFRDGQRSALSTNHSHAIKRAKK